MIGRKYNIKDPKANKILKEKTMHPAMRIVRITLNILFFFLHQISSG
jgi:hypothetical protein